MSLIEERPASGRTRADALRLALADEILSGAIAPGLPLDEAGIAARYQVSRTPVREALRQLAASGLVEIRPHRGAVVAALSEAKLLDLFVAMAELEAVCAGLAAVSMTAVDRRSLAAIHADLCQLVRLGDPERYHEGNEAFHNAIYRGAHNDHLAGLTLATRARLQPFRRAQFRNLGRLALSHEEHDRVVQAIQRGDRDLAAREMRAHIGTVKTAFDHYSARS